MCMVSKIYCIWEYILAKEVGYRNKKKQNHVRLKSFNTRNKETDRRHRKHKATEIEDGTEECASINY